MRVRALLLAAALLVPGCGGGSGPTDPPTPREILVVAIARSDRSLPADETLEGYVAFFFDRDSERLLHAEPVIDRFNLDGSVFSRALSDSFAPAVVPGFLYSEGINVDPGRSFEFQATVIRQDGSEVEVRSPRITVPFAFEIDIPEEVVSGESLTVTWSVASAEKVNIAVGDFSEHVAASLGAFTIPTTVFMGIPEGETAKIQLTAYNTFYAPVNEAISTLQDAEAVAERFRGIDNIEGGVGVFGGAFTLGDMVTIR